MLIDVDGVPEDNDSATGVVWGEASTIVTGTANCQTGTGPEAEIGAAIADGAAGDNTINVLAGTYAEPSYSARVSFHTNEDGENYTVQAFGAGTCLLEVDNATPLLFNTAYDSGTVVWDGIDITSTSATTTGNCVNLADHASTISVTLQSCTLTYANTTRALVYAAGVAGSGRSLTLDDVTCVAAAGSWVWSDSHASMIIQNCTSTHNATSYDMSGLILIGNTANAVCTYTDIYNCTFTNGVVSATKCLVYSTTPITGLIRVRDCAFTISGIGLRQVGASSGLMNLRIENVDWTAVANAATAYNVIMIGTDADVSANTTGAISITDNTITTSGAVTDTAAVGGIMIGPQGKGATVARNVLRGQCLAGADSTSAVGIYARHSDNTLIDDNRVFWAIPVAITEGDNVKITNNDLYTTLRTTHGCLTIRDSNAARTSHDDATAGTLRYDPVNLVVTGNKCWSDKSHCLFIESHDGARTMVKDRWLIDRNAYYASGTAAVATVDTIDKTLAQLLTFWAAKAATTDAGTSLSDTSGVQFNSANDLHRLKRRSSGGDQLGM